MKKSWKIFLFVFIVIVGVCMVTGCGNKKEQVKDGEKYTLIIDIDGLGQVSYADDKKSLEYSQAYAIQSTTVTKYEKDTVWIGAKPKSGWKFVKWLKDESDYSTDKEIKVEVTGNAEYTALFDPE